MPGPLSFAKFAVLLLSIALPLTAADSMGESSRVNDTRVEDVAAAERLFAEADAAIYFPELGRVRWCATAHDPATIREFRESLDRDFPQFDREVYGEYVLKVPATTELPGLHSEAVAPVTPDATIFTDSFETGMGNWTLDDNSLQLYAWGATACEARTGTRSADAIRGGVNSLSCADLYSASVKTTMVRKSCDALAGAAQAWLETYMRIGTETGKDTLGFYYKDAAGKWWGYAFSGSSSSWFRLVFNLKQWYLVGDVTASTCPALLVTFETDSATQSGFGARIDDVTISTSAPTFLSASIIANPATATAPATVNFSSVVTGATSAATYLWTFGDSVGSTAATPTASFTYPVAGDYPVRLRVDDTGGRAYAHKTIRVTNAVPCTISCTATAPATATVGAAASFRGTATPAACTGAPAYAWSFGDGTSSTLQNPTHAYTKVGTYRWSLTTSIGTASCSKSGSVTVVAAADPRRRAIARPPGTAPGYQTVVNPATTAQTFTSGDVSVTIPGGILTAAKTLTITKLTSAPAPNFKGLALGAAYSITLGDLTHFTKPLTVRVRYNAATVRKDIAINRAISGAYFDERQKVWIETPVLIDAAKSEIVIGTDHLTTWGWFMWAAGYRIIESDRFTVVWDDKEMADPLLGPVYNPPDKSNFVDPKVPDYVEDAVAFLNIAFQRYKSAGFKVPPTPINVYVGGSGSSQRGKFFGHGLTINLNSTAQAGLKMEIAHEVFHSFEGAYLTAVGMGTGELPVVGWAPPVLSWSVWYIEAAAEYAAEHVAWDGTLHLMGRALRKDYLEYPLYDVTSDHDYGYSTAHFIKALVDGGANFKAMSEYLFGYDWTNMNDYYYPLHEYLEKVHGSGQGLARQYQNFARNFVFDANGPMPAITDSLHSEVAAYRTTMSGNPQETVKFTLKGWETAKVWGIWFSDALFTPATPKIKYTVSVVGTLPAKVEADVYVLKGDRRVAGGGTPAGSLTQATKSMQVEVEKGDAVYVLAVNTDSKEQQLQVSIGNPLGAFTSKYSMTLLAQGAETSCYWGKDPMPQKNVTDSVTSLTWSGSSFTGTFDGPGTSGSTKHIEVAGQASADMKTLTSATLKVVSKNEATNPTAPNSNSRIEATVTMSLGNLALKSKSADGKTFVYSAAGDELKTRLKSVSWDYVIDFYNIKVKYICNRTIVDYAAADNPPAVEITLTQQP